MTEIVDVTIAWNEKWERPEARVELANGEVKFFEPKDETAQSVLIAGFATSDWVRTAYLYQKDKDLDLREIEKRQG